MIKDFTIKILNLIKIKNYYLKLKWIIINLIYNNMRIIKLFKIIL
jgi:hypothetical protein